MKITDTTPRAYEFACHSAACRPPTSGGTGGSRATKAGQGMGNARGAMGTAKYVRSDGTPVSANYPGSSKAGAAAAARTRAANRALGRTPSITDHVKAEKARLGGRIKADLPNEFKQPTRAEVAHQQKLRHQIYLDSFLRTR